MCAAKHVHHLQIAIYLELIKIFYNNKTNSKLIKLPGNIRVGKDLDDFIDLMFQ